MAERAPADREASPLAHRVALTMFGVGSVICALGAAMKPDLTPAARAVQLAAGGGFGLCAALLRILPRRPWIPEAGALVSVVLLALMLGSSNAIGATPFFFLWPLVYLAYFGDRARVIAGMVVMTVAVGAATAINPWLTDRMDSFVGTVLSVGLMAGLVTVMTTRERELQRALADAADTDALTGLLNRRGIAPELQRLVAGANAGALRLAVVMVDLDHFKRFNDRHGHLAGDVALQRLAAALRGAAGPLDRIARVGGEEFTVVMPSADEHRAGGYVAAVMARLRDEDVADDLRLSISAGIATYTAQTPTVAQLLHRADAALYRAKHAGRGQAIVARAEDDAAAAPLPRAA